MLFRCSDTFGNYLNYVRIGCELVGAPTDSFRDLAVKRAKIAVAKRNLFSARPRHFIRRALLERLICIPAGAPAELQFQLVALMSYAFLLRVPSECLPCKLGGGTFREGDHSSLCFSGERVGLKLQSRKNKQSGSVLWRSCWCRVSCATCPVHAIGRAVAHLAPGSHLFPLLSAGQATRRLRECLASLDIKDAEEYRLHDFRRGHAQDLADSGARLAEILAAGEWRSPAFLKYLDAQSLECDAVVAAHVADSSEDERSSGLKP